MTAILRTLIMLSIISMCGCIASPPIGYHYEPGSFTAKPNDQCAPYYINQPGPLSIINASVGQPKGVPELVSWIDGSHSITIDDAIAMGLPANTVGPVQAISCYATLHYWNGGAATGIFAAISSSPNQPPRTIWISQQALVDAREARQRQTLERQQQSIAYSAYLQACTLEWKVAVEAKALLASGESPDAIEDDLTNRRAYGPNGQVYSSSEDVGAMIHQVVAAVAMPADVRSQNHIPDYTSQLFLADCPRKARQATEAAGNRGGR